MAFLLLLVRYNHGARNVAKSHGLQRIFAPVERPERAFPSQDTKFELIGFSRTDLLLTVSQYLDTVRLFIVGA